MLLPRRRCRRPRSSTAKSAFLDISQHVRLVRDDYMSVQLSRPQLARMLALEPLAAGRCARLRLGRHADATALCGMCLTRASVPSSQVTTRSWARTVFLVVQPRQYRCVRLLPSAACLQRSSAVLATRIAHTHPVHI